MNAVLLGAHEQANRSGDEILAFAGGFGFDGLLAGEIRPRLGTSRSSATQGPRL